MLERLTSYIIAIVGIVGIMLIWTAVQIVWKRVFADTTTNPDALSARGTTCSGNGGQCGCSTGNSCSNDEEQKVVTSIRIKELKY